MTAADPAALADDEFLAVEVNVVRRLMRALRDGALTDAIDKHELNRCDRATAARALAQYCEVLETALTEARARRDALLREVAGKTS
jgi:hypothetical protein